MNNNELKALTKAISNEARALYSLYLRPKVDAQNVRVKINNKQILELLNAHEQKLHLGREISALFQQLHGVGLIEIEGEYSFDRSLNNYFVKLLFVHSAVDLEDFTVHQHHHKMSVSWRPDSSLFVQICQLVGLIETHFSADELGEFIAYWLGRPETLQSPYQWTQKFVLHLKQRRIRQPATISQTKMGHQWIEAEAGIEFDDNVKKLIQKYSGQS